MLGQNYYHSVQWSREECACFYNFGGNSDKWTKIEWPTVVPSGVRFQKTFDAFIEREVQNMACVDSSVLDAWW